MMGHLAKVVAPRLRAAMPDHLTIGERSVPVIVRRHAAARRMTMRLSPCGSFIRLTVPPRVTAASVTAFLERHKGWAAERLSTPGNGRLADGSILPFRGAPLCVRHQPGRRATAIMDEGELRVGGQPEHLPRRVRDFLIREARADLETAVARHAATVGIRPAGLALKDTVSRWGSCSAGRRLSFSWRIVMAPPFVLDYLAAHEVAHLREMNHGPAFWALCRQLCPGMDEGKAWLKRHGATLHAVDLT